jgi:hypothetical protein
MVDKSSKNEFDYLGFEGDKEIKKLVKDETILFTDKVGKINNYGFNQERNLIVTDKALYNTKKKDLKRRIDLTLLFGITISKASDVDEFVIHGNQGEYDYYYISTKKRKISEVIGKAYQQLVKRDIKICLIVYETLNQDLKSLKNCVTSKKEKKKDPTFSRMPESNLVSFSEFMGVNLQRLGSHGNKRSGTLYSKYKDIKEVTLSDFNMLKVLGRGSFGKVNLSI